MHSEKCGMTLYVNPEVSFMQFASILSAKANMTLTNVQNVVENMEEMFKDIRDFSVETIKSLAASLQLPLDNAFVSTSMKNLQSIPSCLNSVNTSFKREKWLNDHGYYIGAREIVLGTREEQRYSSNCQSMRSALVEDKCYFIPLDKLLAKILENKNVARLYRKREVGVDKLPKKVTDFMQTKTFMTHPFY